MKRSIRTLVIAVVGTAAVTGCTALLGSFEVSGGGGPGLPDGESPDGPANGGPDGSSLDGSKDATPPVMCKGAEVACSNVCVTLATSAEHCGRCGHSCGGGVCAAGACKPFRIHDGPLSVGPIGVGDVEVFFATTDGNVENKLVTCPKTGCVAAPKQLALMQYGIPTIAVPQKGMVVFESAPVQTTQRPALYACGAGGCPSPPVSFAADGLNGFEGRLTVFGDRVFYNPGGSGLSWSTCLPGAGGCGAPNRLGSMTRATHGFSADATRMYFVDAASRGSTIATCEQKDTACVPATLVPGDHSSVQTTATFAGKLFWLAPGRDDFNEGKLFVCDLPGCVAPKVNATGLDSPTELLVDASGAYWLTKGGKLQRCTPNGCAGGPTDFAGPLGGPHSIVADEAFVYWAEKTSVWRLAK